MWCERVEVNVDVSLGHGDGFISHRQKFGRHAKLHLVGNDAILELVDIFPQRE